MDESEINGNSIPGFRKACFTEFCQLAVKRKRHTKTIIARDAFECLEPRDMIKSPVICDRNGEGGLQIFQAHILIGHSNHDV